MTRAWDGKIREVSNNGENMKKEKEIIAALQGS